MYDRTSGVTGGSFDTTIKQLARKSIGKKRPNEKQKRFDWRYLHMGVLMYL